MHFIMCFGETPTDRRSNVSRAARLNARGHATHSHHALWRRFIRTDRIDFARSDTSHHLAYWWATSTSWWRFVSTRDKAVAWMACGNCWRKQSQHARVRQIDARVANFWWSWMSSELLTTWSWLVDMVVELLNPTEGFHLSWSCHIRGMFKWQLLQRKCNPPPNLKS